MFPLRRRRRLLCALEDHLVGRSVVDFVGPSSANTADFLLSLPSRSRSSLLLSCSFKASSLSAASPLTPLSTLASQPSPSPAPRAPLPPTDSPSGIPFLRNRQAAIRPSLGRQSSSQQSTSESAYEGSAADRGKWGRVNAGRRSGGEWERGTVERGKRRRTRRLGLEGS